MLQAGPPGGDIPYEYYLKEQDKHNIKVKNYKEKEKDTYKKLLKPAGCVCSF